MRFTSRPEPLPLATGPFGKFSVEEVENAFALESGSLILPGDDTYECLSGNNFWTDHIGQPLILERLETVVETPRNVFQNYIAVHGKPVISYGKDKYVERYVLGCFYSPKTEESNNELRDAGLGMCTSDLGSFTRIYVEYYVVAYVDENTRLLFFGYSADHIDDAQVMTQYVLARSQTDFPLEGDEVYAYELLGPSTGDFEGFSDSESIQDVNFLGNHGHIVVTLTLANLTQTCPDALCGSYVPGQIANPLAPDADWPSQLMQYQCEWFPCMNLPGCPEMTCDAFEPGMCTCNGPSCGSSGLPTASPGTPTATTGTPTATPGTPSATSCAPTATPVNTVSPSTPPSEAIAMHGNVLYLLVGCFVVVTTMVL
jgi:hypothetical protein